MSAPEGPPPRKEIYGPLDTLAKILYDANITDIIENSTSTSPEDIAEQIWEDYGGNEKGNADQSKTGQRSPSDVNIQQDQGEKDRDSTDGSKWLRLPKGKTIEDITPLKDLTNIMSGLVMGTIKKSAGGGGGGPPPGGGGPPPGGGMPPPPGGGGGPPPPGGGGGPPPGGGMPPGLASSRARIALAAALDRDGLYHLADSVERVALASKSDAEVVRRIQQACAKFPPSVGYGKCFWNARTKTAYWVSSDYDKEGVVQNNHDTLRKISGVRKVEGESESSPTGGEWRQVFPKK